MSPDARIRLERDADAGVATITAGASPRSSPGEPLDPATAERSAQPGSGPLAGLRVLEFAGIGPVPLAATLLAGLGARITRVERPAGVRGLRLGRADRDVYARGRTSAALDLRSTSGRSRALELIAGSDVLLEGNRPGVMERLGLGPDVCLARNPRLIYARVTGWGQTGPRAGRAGHDINYLALSGALHAMGPADRPPSPPLNLVADYGGGAMLLAFGVTAALFERERSHRGQVIDAAMADGVVALCSLLYSLVASGDWSPRREANVLDGGAHYYRVYETADHRFVAVGAIEPQFYAELLDRLGLASADWPQNDRTRWSELRERLGAIFRTRTLAEWDGIFDGSDACVTPVRTFAEAAHDPHLAARGAIITRSGVAQPGPVPRFSRTPGSVPEGV